MISRKTLWASGLVVLLTACGGGGGGESGEPAAVKPKPVAISEKKASYPVGSLVTLNLSGPDVSQGVSATLDGAPVVIAESESHLVALLPEVAPGAHTLKVTIGGTEYPLSITTSAGASIADPKGYVSAALGAAQAKVTEELQTATGDEAAYLQQIADALAAQVTTLDSQTDAQLLEAARVISANSFDSFEPPPVPDATAAALPVSFATFTNPNLEACQENAQLLAIFGVTTAAAIAGIAISPKLAKVSPWLGLTVFGTSGFIAYKGLKLTTAEIGLALKNCIASVEVKLGSDDEAELMASIASVAVVVNDETLAFSDDVLKKHTLNIAGTISSVVADSVFTRVRRAGTMFANFRANVADLVTLPAIEAPLLNFRRNSPAVVDAREYSISNISDSRIEGSLGSSAEKIGLKFKYSDGVMSSPIYFTFYLKEDSTQELAGPFKAKLTGPTCTSSNWKDAEVESYSLGCYTSENQALTFEMDETITRHIATGLVDFMHFEERFDQLDGRPLSRQYSETNGFLFASTSTHLDPSLPPAVGAVIEETRMHYPSGDYSTLYEVYLGPGQISLQMRHVSISCHYSGGVQYASRSSYTYEYGVGGYIHEDPQELSPSEYCHGPEHVKALFYVDKLQSRVYQKFSDQLGPL